MFGIVLFKKSNQLRPHKYYKCSRCGYISIVNGSKCPICRKDGHSIKLK